MRNNYRHPVAGIFLMVLILAAIAGLFVMLGSIAPFGQALVLVIASSGVIAGAVMLILSALRRTGVHRLAEVRTWPQK